MNYTKIIPSLMAIALSIGGASTCSASNDLKEEFKGNWSGQFRLLDGSIVTHEPDFTSLGFIRTGKGISMKAKSYNGLPLSDEGLQLKTDSTREEFIEALLKSGLYKN